MKLKHTILFLTFVALTIFSFGQYREFIPAIPYTKGDTVKVTSKGSLFVAAVDLKSPEKIPSENRYWNYAGEIPNGLTLEGLDARLKVLEKMFQFEFDTNVIIIPNGPGYVPINLDSLPFVLDSVVYWPPVIDSVVYIPPTGTLGTDIYTPGIRTDSTLGTIQAGSNILRLKKNMNYVIGDVLMIPVGYEAGKGQPGTLGVDDSWPYLKFNTVKELEASVQPSGTFAASYEDGRVRRNEDGVWRLYDHWGYYLERMIPIGYRASITAISDDGMTLEMSKPAKASVTDAPVYYDNSFYLNTVLNFRDSHEAEESFTFPKGRIAVGQVIVIKNNDNENVKTIIEGNGATLFSPAGMPCLSVQMLLNNCELRNLNFEGNMTDEGFGLTWWDSNPDLQGMIISKDTRANFYPFENRGGLQAIGRDCYVHHVNIKNTMSPLLTIHNNSKADYFNLSVTSQHNQDGWQLLMLYADGAEASDFTITGRKMTGGFEVAKSVKALVQRGVITNAINAVNSAGGFTLDDIVCNYTKDSKSDWMNWGHPSLDVNKYFTSINGADDLSAKPSYIKNYTINQLDYIESATKGTMRGIQLGAGISNVTLQNIKITKPAGGDKFSLFVEDPNNVVVDGFSIDGAIAKDDNGNGGKFYADISVVGAGVGSLKNITGANYIWRSSGVTIEKSYCNIFCGVK
jgi:hypothetical protein